MREVRELPPGWSLTTVRQIGQGGEQAVLTGPFGTSMGRSDFTASGVPVLTIGCLTHRGIDLAKAMHVTSEKASALKRYQLRHGDLLFSRMATVGRASIVERRFEGALFNYHLMRLRLLPEVIDPRLFVYYVHGSQVVRDYVRSVNHGATRDGINTEQLLDLPVVLPPPLEQPGIVAAIESHFSRLDAATATLERVQRNLERYRASVLKAAVEGRLVPTEAELAKKEGRSYEPASVLLKRILAERRRRWEEAELAKLNAKGKPPTDDRWKAKYEGPAAPDSDGLPDLPEGWCWTTSESMFWGAGYGTSGKCTPDSIGPPVLRIPNVQDQALNLSDLKFAVDPGTLAADGAVEPGDFLFIRTNGSVNLIGRGAVIVDAPPRECFFASYLIRLRLARVEGLWRWFAFAWHTSVVRDQLVRDAASSAGQHNVSLSAASKYLMPLPPAREQERILAEVDGLDTGRGSAAQDTRICRDRIDRLRQSILKWAFEGRLVDGRSAFSDGQQASAAHEVVDGGK